MENRVFWAVFRQKTYEGSILDQSTWACSALIFHNLSDIVASFIPTFNSDCSPALRSGPQFLLTCNSICSTTAQKLLGFLICHRSISFALIKVRIGNPGSGIGTAFSWASPSTDIGVPLQSEYFTSISALPCNVKFNHTTSSHAADRRWRYATRSWFFRTVLEAEKSKTYLAALKTNYNTTIFSIIFK